LYKHPGFQPGGKVNTGVNISNTIAAKVRYCECSGSALNQFRIDLSFPACNLATDSVPPKAQAGHSSAFFTS